MRVRLAQEAIVALTSLRDPQRMSLFPLAWRIGRERKGGRMIIRPQLQTRPQSHPRENGTTSKTLSTTPMLIHYIPGIH